MPGVSMDGPLRSVLSLGFMATFGFYRFMKIQQAFHDGEGTPFYQWCTRQGAKSHIEKKGFWRWMRRLADDVLNGRGKD